MATMLIITIPLTYIPKGKAEVAAERLSNPGLVAMKATAATDGRTHTLYMYFALAATLTNGQQTRLAYATSQDLANNDDQCVVPNKSMILC